jgi:hypothetical protein
VTLTVANGSGSDSTSRTVTVVTASGILTPDRVIDWSRAGVYENEVKGIPDYPIGVICAPPAYAVDPTGVSDSAAGINAAISACPPGQAVLLPAGTYRVNSTISLKSRCVLRGAEPFTVTPLTKIISYGNHDIVRMFGTSAAEIVRTIVSGFGKDSDTITLASGDVSGFAVNDIVLIDELNDGVERTNTGNSGTCTWCGRENGTRSMAELKRIKSINTAANTVTFTRSLYYNYEAAYIPQMLRKVGSGAIYNAGLESIHLEQATGDTSVSDGNGVQIRYGYHNWVYRVEISGVKVDCCCLTYGSLGNEVRECYFHDTPAGSNMGSHGYGLDLYGWPTDNLLINNILTKLHSPCTLGSAGACGNVIAYNYTLNNIHDANNDWFLKSTGAHGSHTHMNLVEGNITTKLGYDFIWGSGSNGVNLRNWVTGIPTYWDPSVGAWHTVTQAMSTIYCAQANHYNSFVGNVIGYDGMHLAHGAAVEPYPLDGNGDVTIWRLGYWSEASTGMPADPRSASTLIRHGNYNYISRTTDWESTISDRVIPNSYFLTEKPAWFGTVPWPPIGPDRTPMVTDIPAKKRYDTGQFFAKSL